MTAESPPRSSSDEALSKRLAELSPAKRALVEQRMRALRGPTAGAGIPRRPEGEPAPLAFAQELLWQLEQVAPGTSTYNVPRAMRVRGALDMARLQQALDAVVERHAILRTAFEEHAGVARQVVRPAQTVALAITDLQGMDAADREAKCESILRVEASRPFDLARDALLRATLVRLAPNEHALLLVSHHIASDGASGGILMQDLAALYRDGGSPLAPLSVRYSDFASWQRAQLNDARMAQLLGYWRTRLAGAPVQLELPTDRPRPAVPSFDGGRRSIELSRAIADACATLRARRASRRSSCCSAHSKRCCIAIRIRTTSSSGRW